ncbi:hypothetical protein HAX54_022150, partial [Datura stramonium]|nr:hypothetical protein [Datura stramonium]
IIPPKCTAGQRNTTNFPPQIRIETRMVYALQFRDLVLESRMDQLLDAGSQRRRFLSLVALILS